MSIPTSATIWLALLVLGALALVLHRKKLDWTFQREWADKKERRMMLGQLLAAGLLSYVSAPTARLWLGAFIVSQGVLLYFLAARRTVTSALPNALKQSSGSSEAG